MKDPNTGQALGSASKMTFGPTSGPGTGSPPRTTTSSTHRSGAKTRMAKTSTKKSIAKHSSCVTKIVMKGNPNQNDTTLGNPPGSMT